MNMTEIRMNDQYTHLYISSYLDEGNRGSIKKNDSTPIIKRKTIFTENFIMKYKNQLNTDRGMIPPNCRYLENVNDGSIIVIEEPPNIRTININLSLKHEIYDLEKRGFLTKYGYGKINDKQIEFNTFVNVVFHNYFGEFWMSNKNTYLKDGMSSIITQA